MYEGKAAVQSQQKERELVPPGRREESNDMKGERWF
jgi:hypothetical protein